MTDEQFHEPIIRTFDPSEFGDHIADKLGAKMLLELLYNLVASVEKDGWDQPPMLLLVRQRAREQAMEGGLDMMLVEVTRMPGFQRAVQMQMDTGGRPHHAIINAAYAWDQTIKKGEVPPTAFDELVAVAMVHEGWALFAKPGDEADQERVTAISRERQVHAQPDRVEIRIAQLVGRNDLRVGYTAPRDGVPMHIVSQVAPGQKDPSGTHSGGNIPNALHFFMKTIELGHLPMEWVDWDALFDEADGQLR